MPDDEIQEYVDRNIPLVRFTDTTITDPKCLREEIQLVRERGYAVGYRDHIPIGSAIAFPVFDGDGHAVGAIAIGTADEKAGDERLQSQLQEIRAEMNSLNRRTGALVSTTH